MVSLNRLPRGRETLDATAREGAPGAFVTLSEGVTHYEMVGPDVGRAVVLIHGFSVPSFIWSPTFEALAEAGFRVVRYDLFGRGYSDRPSGAYDLARFDRQILDLITALDLGEVVDVVGLSMGGAIAVGFADRHPERVRTLTLIDPAGFPMSMPGPIRLLKVPLLGEILMATVGRRVLITGLARHAPERTPTSTLMRQYLVQMRYRGFVRALLSTVRHGPLETMAPAYRRVGAQPRPVLLIWGREDTLVPFALSAQARAAMPKAEFHAVDNAGHAPHIEQPELISSILTDFLRKPTESVVHPTEEGKL